MADRRVGMGEVASDSAVATPPYAYYALAILTLANFCNIIDRTIVTVVAHAVQLDLRLTDAQMGFLMGAAFAVLYGVLGIAIGRIADALSRTRLMAAGLVLWSGMTAFSGLATGFGGMASARIGVGIGEAVANPCSHALVADYFPPRHRSTMMSLYLVGTHLGSAAALLFGGLLLQHWSTLCHSLPGGACGLPAWRAAFFILGWPGLLLALLIATLREPARHHAAATVKPVRLILRELSAAAPPFTVFNLLQVGGWPAAGRNLAMAGMIIVASAGLGRLTGDWPQWIAVAVGLYSVSTWAQVLRLRDAPLFKLTFGCPTFAFSMFGSALLLCFTGGVHVWSATYAMRVLGATPGQVGLYMGLTSAVAAIAGVILGGLVSDHFRRRDARGPIWVCLGALLVSVPAAVAMLRAHEFSGFVMAFTVFILASMSWSGAAAAMVQDLVLPRMRATASAAFSLVIILVGTGMGPYLAGKVSTLTGSLATGLYSLLIIVPAAAGLLLLAANRLKHETAATRRDRARAAGEIL